MSEKFEIEFNGEGISGPRYVVDMGNGEIRKDESFISGEAALSEDTVYPGDSETVRDLRTAKEAYGSLIPSGIEPGEVYEGTDVNGRGVRVKVYDEDPGDLDRIEDVDSAFIDRAVEALNEVV